MTKRRTWLAVEWMLLATTVAGAGCGAGAAPSTGDVVQSSKARIVTPAVPAADVAQLAADNDAFAVALYQTLRAAPGNIVFSPASLSFALAMTYAGAAAQTATQMATTLHFALPADRLHPAFDALDLALTAPTSAPGAFELTLANALWAQRGFMMLPSFLDVLSQDYGAGVRLVDFMGATEPARRSINQWVSDQTAGKIPELLMMGALDTSTRLVLTNAVYFKADWQRPFDGDSADGTFTTPSGPVTVPMMQGQVSASLWTGAGYAAAALPYAGGTTSMVLIVPDAGTFDAFEAGLTAESLSAVMAGQAGASRGDVRMPRFKFDQHFSVKDQLMALGMTDAFTPGLADFSGIDGAQDLLISDIVHEATIAVDEKGTEAAAATGVVVVAQIAQALLDVNRPFVFVLRDDATGAILFLGRVVDPS